MSNYHILVRDQRYNPQTQEFEALVVFFENGETQSYPCAVGLPIQADLAHVTRHLVSQARSMRKRGAVELVSRAPVSHTPRVTHAENLARHMLGSLGWLTSKAA